MGILSDLMGKARSFIGRAEAQPPPPEATRAIWSTVFDQDAWQQVLDGNAAWQRKAAEMRQTIDNSDDLLADLHASLYRTQPTLREASEMAPTHAVNHQVMSTLIESEEMQHLRLYTAGDEYASAIAMQSLNDTMMTALQQVQQNVEEAEQRAKEAQQRLQEAVDNAAKAEAEGSPEEQQEAEQNLTDAMQEAEAEAENEIRCGGFLQGEIEAGVRGKRGAIGAAAKEVTEKLDEERALFAAYGISPGDLQYMSVEERFALAERLRNDRLARWVRLLGSFKVMQKAKCRQRVTDAVDQVHGVHLSNDIGRLVPSELVNLTHPLLRSQFMVRYSQRRLLTYKTRGREKAGQGPIIAVVDESGSMKREDVGGASREAWSKAFALALLDQARQRGRDFIYIGFASEEEQHVIEFPGGRTTLDSVLTLTGHFFNGGTSFMEPLSTALDYVERYYKAGKARPDIVMVTDGTAGTPPQGFLNRYWDVKRRASITTYGVAIGCSSSGALRAVSDEVREISELVCDPDAVGEFFTTI